MGDDVSRTWATSVTGLCNSVCAHLLVIDSSRYSDAQKGYAQPDVLAATVSCVRAPMEAQQQKPPAGRRIANFGKRTAGAVWNAMLW